MCNLVNHIIHSTDLFHLADNLEEFVGYTAKLGAKGSELVAELRKALDAQIEIGPARVHNKYRILYGQQGVCSYLNTYWQYTDSCDHNLMVLMGIYQDIRNEFTAPHGGQISQNQIESLMTSIEENTHLLSKLYGDNEYLEVILLEHTYKEFNSKTNLLSHPNGSLKERIFMSYTKPEMVKSVEIIFLHELGHVVHHRISKSAKTVPEGFKTLLFSLYGHSAEFKNFLDVVYDYVSYDEQVTELFADCFAAVIAKIYIPSLANDYVCESVNILVHHIQHNSALFAGSRAKISDLTKSEVSNEAVILSILSSYFTAEIDLAAGLIGASHEYR